MSVILSAFEYCKGSAVTMLFKWENVGQRDAGRMIVCAHNTRKSWIIAESGIFESKN